MLNYSLLVKVIDNYERNDHFMRTMSFQVIIQTGKYRSFFVKGNLFSLLWQQVDIQYGQTDSITMMVRSRVYRIVHENRSLKVGI